MTVEDLGNELHNAKVKPSFLEMNGSTYVKEQMRSGPGQQVLIIKEDTQAPPALFFKRSMAGIEVRTDQTILHGVIRAVYWTDGAAEAANAVNDKIFRTT
jgi:hypothetical protein